MERITEILAAHRFWWANHASVGSDAHCGCGDRPRDMYEWNSHVATLIAQAAEGHYRPRIETVEQLDAQPYGSAILDHYASVLVRDHDAWLEPGASELDPQLPAILLWSPGADE
ncbi:hypothetical protein [Mycolicibacter heraklionensis]|uniref:hypothetical protein n=1 Tax=Mycolicibacter heraklionensis TaxID=512402 RepID=UPI0007EA4BBD|nr:hypothetical protein [Mycolicibacter heraklionensis]OBG32393.1 hypothetical protein A5671_07625 [Mycolicibacter heraklionensis]